jgi:hypothetical protein
MEKVILTGKISRLSTKRDKDLFAVTRYSPNTERYVIVANICLVGEDGITYWFNSPAVKERVTSAPGVAVVGYELGKEAEKWWDKIDGSGVATQNETNENSIICKLKEGDVIKVKGFVKYRRPNYTSLTRMTLL